MKLQHRPVLALMAVICFTLTSASAQNPFFAMDNALRDVKTIPAQVQLLNYRGPVGVIGFGIKQPAAKHLKQSMDFWRSIDQQKTNP